MHETDTQNFRFTTTGADCARDGIVVATILIAGSAILLWMHLDDSFLRIGLGLQTAFCVGLLGRLIWLARSGTFQLACDGETLAVSSPIGMMGRSAMIRLSDITRIEVVDIGRKQVKLVCRIFTDSESIETIRIRSTFDVPEFVRYLARHAPREVFDKSCQQCFASDE